MEEKAAQLNIQYGRQTVQISARPEVFFGVDILHPISASFHTCSGFRDAGYISLRLDAVSL